MSFPLLNYTAVRKEMAVSCEKLFSNEGIPSFEIFAPGSTTEGVCISLATIRQSISLHKTINLNVKLIINSFAYNPFPLGGRLEITLLRSPVSEDSVIHKCDKYSLESLWKSKMHGHSYWLNFSDVFHSTEVVISARLVLFKDHLQGAALSRIPRLLKEQKEANDKKGCDEKKEIHRNTTVHEDVFLTFKQCDNFITTAPSGRVLEQFLTEKDGKIGMLVPKELLISSSKVFAAMFKTNMKEKQTNVLELSSTFTNRLSSSQIVCHFVAALCLPTADAGILRDNVCCRILQRFFRGESNLSKKRTFTEFEDEEPADFLEIEEKALLPLSVMKKNDRYDLETRSNFIKVREIDSLMIPLLDLFNQYGLQESAQSIYQTMISGVCEKTILPFYQTAILYNVNSLLHACAYYGCDLLTGLNVNLPFCTGKDWDLNRHRGFYSYLESFLSTEEDVKKAEEKVEKEAVVE